MIYRVSANVYDPAGPLKARELCESIETALALFTADTPDKATLAAWGGYELALGVYCNQMDLELLSQGWVFNDADAVYKSASLYRAAGDQLVYPIWWDDDNISLSHQSRLIRDKRYNGVFPEAPKKWPILNPIVIWNDDEAEDYDLVVAKAEMDLLKNLPKKVRKLVRNG